MPFVLRAGVADVLFEITNSLSFYISLMQGGVISRKCSPYYPGLTLEKKQKAKKSWVGSELRYVPMSLELFKVVNHWKQEIISKFE